MAFHQDKTLKKLKVPKPKSEIEETLQKKKNPRPKAEVEEKNLQKRKKIYPRPKSEVEAKLQKKIQGQSPKFETRRDERRNPTKVKKNSQEKFETKDEVLQKEIPKSRPKLKQPTKGKGNLKIIILNKSS